MDTFELIAFASIQSRCKAEFPAVSVYHTKGFRHREMAGAHNSGTVETGSVFLNLLTFGGFFLLSYLT